jgi:hypothetical protein
MESSEAIETSFMQLLKHMEDEQFKGYDPYDGLESPLWKLPLMKDADKVQFYFQQLVKRSPLNIRPLLFIRKGLNPVTLGLALQAYTDYYRHTGNPDFLNKAKGLVTQLDALHTRGFSGHCWGYDFRWASRYALIPAGQPTVVATGIISNALFAFWQTTSDDKTAAMVNSAAKFVEKDLHRTSDSDGNFCFSYSPFDKEQVYNASLKGARILSQSYRISGKSSLKELSMKAVNWVVSKQEKSGAWKYSESKSGYKTDNYHTGYILDCLADCIEINQTPELNTALEMGRAYFLNNFFEISGQPKFYDKAIWPADCTSGGQAILSLLKMKRKPEALKTAHWMINNMQSEKGFFYFRRYNNHVEKTSFMRWSNAWMLASLSALMASTEKEVQHA